MSLPILTTRYSSTVSPLLDFVWVNFESELILKPVAPLRRRCEDSLRMGDGTGPLLRALVEYIADAEDGLEEDLETVAASDLWSGTSGEDSQGGANLFHSGEDDCRGSVGLFLDIFYRQQESHHAQIVLDAGYLRWRSEEPGQGGEVTLESSKRYLSALPSFSSP
jgi:hypothetical protein